jgi:hypothetical protein
MRCVVLLATFVIGWLTGAKAAPEGLVVEEAMVPSPQPQMMIYVRNKHPASMANFSAAHASLRSRRHISSEHYLRS